MIEDLDSRSKVIKELIMKRELKAMRENLKAISINSSARASMSNAKDFAQIEISDKNICKNSVYVVIPCYNEKSNLTQLMKDLHHSLSRISNFEIIVVNDGSSDGSDSILTKLAVKYPINLLHHDQNMGLSSTLRDGLLSAIAIAKANDLVITMDADNTHKSCYIQKMLEAINEGAEIVIASRYIKGGIQIGVTNNRIMLSKFANYILSFLSGLKIKDITSGYRCYRASVLKKGLEKYDSHFVDAKGFEVQAELMVKLGSLSTRVREIPFELKYNEKQGKSKMPLFETINNYIQLSLKILAWRWQRNS